MGRPAPGVNPGLRGRTLRFLNLQLTKPPQLKVAPTVGGLEWTMRMMMTALAATLASGFAGAAHAQSQLAAGAHIGTTGVGAELYFNVNPVITLRAGGDYGKIDRELESNDITYDGSAEWRTVDIGIDLHPMSNPFFVSAALFVGDRTVEVDAVSARNVVLSGVAFSPAQIGTITGEANLSDTTPFVGIGWDNTFYSSGQWGFRALAGAAFSDDPSVSLRASGPFANDPRVQAYLREEERQIREDADSFKTYPVLSLGVNYRF
jgi:hypothetical protein